MAPPEHPARRRTRRRHRGRALLALALCGASVVALAEIPNTVRRALAARDFEQASAWLEAHRAEPDAAFELGRLYRLGLGVEQDVDEARALFEQAAQSGHVEAAQVLSRLCTRLGDADCARRWTPDPKTTIETGRSGPGGSATTGLLAGFRRGAAAPDAPVGPLDPVKAGRVLAAAAEQGRVDWVRYLLASGVAVDSTDEYGATALQQAVAARESAAVRELLDAGADPRVAAHDGTTALHRAVAVEEVEMARWLLKAGADADAVSQSGWSPRMLAERGDSRALRSLFGAKARPAVAGGSRDERLLRAAQQGDRATLRGLLKESRAVPLELAARLLELAVAAQDAAMLALLLGHGLDGAVSDGLLIAAIDASCDPCVDALLQAGAAPDAVARDGRPALLVAARDGRSGSMAALLTAGAPVDVTDPAGRTALWWATRNEHSEVAVALLAAGATTAPDRDGVAPLHLAAQNDDGVLLRQLLPLVPVDLASNAGSSALQLAAHAGALTAARLLLGAGAEVDRRDPAGDTALMVAARAGQLDMADMLLRAGASLTQRNERFENAHDLMADRPEPGWQVLLTRTDGGLGDLLGSIGGDQSR